MTGVEHREATHGVGGIVKEYKAMDSGRPHVV